MIWPTVRGLRGLGYPSLAGSAKESGFAVAQVIPALTPVLAWRIASRLPNIAVFTTVAKKREKQVDSVAMTKMTFLTC